MLVGRMAKELTQMNDKVKEYGELVLIKLDRIKTILSDTATLQNARAVNYEDSRKGRSDKMDYLSKTNLIKNVITVGMNFPCSFVDWIKQPDANLAKIA